jgi:hypothetical protein
MLRDRALVLARSRSGESLSTARSSSGDRCRPVAPPSRDQKIGQETLILYGLAIGILGRFMKPVADAVDYGLVAKFTGADDQGKRSWISTVYMPIYQLRSYVKEKIKPRSLLAYNVIKFGSIGLLLFLIYCVI